MTQIFNVDYHIGYSGISPNLISNPYKIVEYMQETSIMHTESTKHPMSWYVENMRGWMLSAWNIEIYQHPVWQSIINVKTWPSSFKGIIGERSFEMTYKNGEKIACAVSRWFYSDIEKRRPIRVPEEIAKEYMPLKEPVIQINYKFPKYDLFTYVSGRVFIATRREIDTNYHVNNTKYVEWAMDDIKDNVYYRYNLTNIKVNYKKECIVNTKIRSEVYEYIQDKFVEYIMIFSEADNNDIVFAEVYTHWNKD